MCWNIVFIFILLHNSIFSTKHILGISTLSREDHSVAQTRELKCTKVVLPRVIDELAWYGL